MHRKKDEYLEEKMKRWVLLTKKVCVMAVCAALLPGAYETARQSLLGWPRQAVQEGMIPDGLIVKKQGLETAMDVGAMSSGWNSGVGTVGSSSAAAVTSGSNTDTQTGNTVNAAAQSSNSSGNGSSPRVIRSGSRSDVKEGPGKEWDAVMTVATPITGYLGGSKLTLLANQTNTQMLSVLVETNNGRMIMIDGGTEGDSGHLVESLLARGGHVDAWLITHPHSDHVGALKDILTHPEYGVTIGNIYYSFQYQGWYQDNEAYRADLVGELVNAFQILPPQALHGDIVKGQEIQVDNVKITVMNQPYLFSTNSINNSSVAYMLDINGKKALFLGDMGEEAGKQLIADNSPENLKCDIVQMAHHGQDGVGFEVYKILSPQICLWGAPGWLWNNDSGSGVDSGNWKTIETRKWMAQLGVPYHLCIKDGDQVIQ